MNVLRGNQGPRFKSAADEGAPYETITIDKLTPIIGAEIGGVDLRASVGTARWTRSIARWRRTR